ncbi:MAG: phosphatase family protein [Sphingomonadales bacterium]|nr:phosphatase family protein [Sphingomonadales bacterium]
MKKTKHAAKTKVATVEKLDRKVARVAGSKRDTPIVKAVGTISDLADQPPLITISTLTIAAGVVVGRDRLVRTGVRMLASHLLATQMKSFVKHRVDRTRPFVILRGDEYHARKGTSHAKRENSFPSGHTAGAVAVARAVARDFPASAPIGYTAAATAAAVQLPRAAHFASDVLVGAMIGLAAEALVALVLPAGQSRSEP